MTSLRASDRHRFIVDALQANGRIETAELVRQLNVSSVTIRADLEELEREQILRRIRGGAIAVRPSRYERPHEASMQTRSHEKDRIAAVAASMVRDNETIILDTGSTTAAITRALPRALQNLAVVTNSLNIAQDLKRHAGITVVVTGGTLRPRLNSLVSPFGQLLLREVNADIAFMSCSGVDPEKGFTNANWEEAEIKQSMIRAARRVVFVADSAKLKHVATARIADISQADVLITDSGAAPDVLRELRQGKLQVIVA